MPNEKFTSNKPYLFRAILDWLLDNEATPYVLVDTTKPQVEVPNEHIKDNQIVLNVSPSAVQNWQVDNEAISFSARFSGVARQIYVPMNALMAVYAQENGLGMAFPAQDEDSAKSESEIGSEEADIEEKTVKPATTERSKDKKVSHLKVVK